jgi:hypothetical protein
MAFISLLKYLLIESAQEPAACVSAAVLRSTRAVNCFPDHAMPRQLPVQASTARWAGLRDDPALDYAAFDMPARPKTVPIVAAFLFAAAAIAGVVGLSLLFPNPLLDRLWQLNPEGAVFFHSIGRVSGVFLLGLGTAMLFAARALLRGHLWSWWFASTLFTVEAVSNLVSYFVIHDALRTVTGFVIASIFLLALCSRRTRDHFFRRQ